jgi:hypothetical protein
MSLVRRAPPTAGRALEADEVGQVEDEVRKLRAARQALERAMAMETEETE